MTTERSRQAVLRCVELFNRGTLEWIDSCYREDAELIELPHRLSPDGRRGDREFLRRSAAAVLRMFPDRRMRVLAALADGDRVALEIDWTGTAAATPGGLTAGTVLHTRAASFFVVADGLIVKHTDYCAPMANGPGAPEGG
jgi:ketosteroid isomerase-like protein